MTAQLCPYIKSTEYELYLNIMRGKEVKLTHPLVWSMRNFRGIGFFLTSACLDSDASMPLCEVGQQGVPASCREHWCLPSFQAKLNRSAQGLSPPLAVSRVPQDRLEGRLPSDTLQGSCRARLAGEQFTPWSAFYPSRPGSLSANGFQELRNEFCYT